MFGWDQKFKQAHVLSHLEDAAIAWLLEAGNPILAKVPSVARPILIQELQDVQQDAKKAIATGSAPAAPAPLSSLPPA